MQTFTHFSLPDLRIDAYMPSDVTLIPPTRSSLPLDMQHFLVTLPWDESWMAHIPQDFHDFFRHVLPHLHVRATDVHVSYCLDYLDDAVAQNPNLNRRVLGLALILHDCGWSQLSEAEIAASLGVTGLALNAMALDPKEKHAVEGEKLARQLLNSYSFDTPLTPDEIELILLCVLYHDKPELVSSQSGTMKPEIQYLVDLDHLWSFIHHDFWLDTIRKGLSPQEYAKNLQNDLDDYFVTPWGKKKAKELLIQRNQEVSDLQAFLSQT